MKRIFAYAHNNPGDIGCQHHLPLTSRDPQIFSVKNIATGIGKHGFFYQNRMAENQLKKYHK